jgi:hypothetical protein
MPAGANPSIRYKNKGAQIGRDAGIGWKHSSPTMIYLELPAIGEKDYLKSISPDKKKGWAIPQPWIIYII